MIEMRLTGGWLIYCHHFDYMNVCDRHMYTVWGTTGQILLLLSCLAHLRLPEYYPQITVPSDPELDIVYMSYINPTYFPSKRVI